MYSYPQAMHNWALYSCRKDCQEPDWTQYQQLEVRPVSIEAEDQGRQWLSALSMDEKSDADLWTLYARRNDENERIAEAISDAPTEQAIMSIATLLSHRSGLPLA